MTGKGFVLRFVLVYLVLVCINMVVIGINAEGGALYSQSELLSSRLNYVDAVREVTLVASIKLATLFGLKLKLHGEHLLLAASGSGIRMVYSCIGLDVYAFWIAFTATFPMRIFHRIAMLIMGVSLIFVLNVSRVVLLAAGWGRFKYWFIDAHLVFNIVVYGILIGVAFSFIKLMSHKR